MVRGTIAAKRAPRQGWRGRAILKSNNLRHGWQLLTLLKPKQVGIDPFSGRLFAFRNRAGTAVKLLIYDENGFWLCHKRFCDLPISLNEFL